jgi:uncharacterized repeat protein (TIGR01451 family)
MFHTHTKKILKRMMGLGLLACLAFVALLSLVLAQTNAALAATAPPLGVADTFAVLGWSTVTNTGPTIVTGDLGLSPGLSITGFPPGTVIGGTQIIGGVAATAQADALTAYNNLAGQACLSGYTISADLGGMTLQPGVYCSGSTMGLTGTLTLDAMGDPNAVWVFQMGSSLTAAGTVSMINGGQAGNVFWQVGSSATLGTGTVFKGNIIAYASITLDTGASLSGRALALTAAVTLDNNSVSVSQPLIPGSPTLGKAFSPTTIIANDDSTLTITLTNPSASPATLSADLIDTLPSGVFIASTPAAGTDCGGVVTATPAGTTVTLSAAGSSIPADNSCTVWVDVTSAIVGSHINTLAVGALQTDQGDNAVPALASLTVNPPVAPGTFTPTVSKSFNLATINAGGTSLLTIILSNSSNNTADAIITLTDTLPLGVVIAPTPAAGTTCTGGVLTAIAGTDTIVLTGGIIPVGVGTTPGTCTVTVNVTAANAGSYINTLAAGDLQTLQGDNAYPAIATLIVPQAPAAPTLSKAFNPAIIVPGRGGNVSGVSTLTITLNNPNSTVATLTARLTDFLPSGMKIANPTNASTTCGGGTTVTATAGGTKVTLPAGRWIPVNGSCTVTVDVTAICKGSYRNKLPARALRTNKGSNATRAVAILTVI